MLADGGVHVGLGQRRHPGLELRAPDQAAVVVEVAAQLAGQGAVLGAAQHAALEDAVHGVLELGLGDAVLDQARHFLGEGPLHPGDVLGRGDGEQLLAGAFIQDVGVEARTHRIAQAVGLAHAIAQARLHAAAAEDVVGHHQRGVVRVRIRHRELARLDDHRIGLVRRLEHALHRRRQHQRHRDALEGLGRGPVAEVLLHQRGHLRRVEVAHHRDFAVARAVEGRVEVAHVGQLRALDLLERLFDRGDVVGMVLGPLRAEVTGAGTRGHRLRFAALGLDAGDVLGAQLLELGLGEGGRLEHLRDERHHFGQVLPGGGGAHAQALGAAVEAHARLEVIEAAADLLAGHRPGAAREHGRRQAARALAAHHVVELAEAQRHADGHRVAAGFLGQQRQFGAVGQFGHRGAAVDVGGRRIEGFARGHGSAAPVVGDQRGHVRRVGDFGAVGRVGGDEARQRAVAGLEVGLGHARDVLRGHRLDAVALQEEQAPVARGDGFRQRGGGGVGVVEQKLGVLEQLGARLGHFVVGEGRGVGLLHLLDQLGGHRHVVAVAGQLRQHQHRAGLGQLPGTGADRGDQAGLDQGLVQAAAGRVAQHLAQHFQRRAVGMRGGRQVVVQADQAGVADAAHHHFALAVLHGLARIGGLHRLGRALERAEGRGHFRQRLRRVDAASDEKRGVVGAVVRAIEGLQPLDRHVFDVRAGADGGLAVVVPEVGGGRHPLQEHAHRIGFARLHFVAHHRHLAVEVAAAHVGIHHAVGFQRQQPVQVVLACGEAAEVVGSVQPGAGVVADAAAAHFARDVGVGGRALEQQVLKQVGHAGFAVVLVARADQVGEVHRDRGLGGVGEQQHAQAVAEAVFGDAFDGGDFDHALGRRGFARGRGRGQRERQEKDARQAGKQVIQHGELRL